MSTPLSVYVKRLLKIVAEMQHDYPSKRFTLDGRLVGDIGEILAEQLYDIKLFDGQEKRHDAESNGKLVQIKTTMKNALTIGEEPEYFLGLRVDENGDVEEIFNGPGWMVWELVKNRRRPKTFLHALSLTRLREMNKIVSNEDRIPKRLLAQDFRFEE